MILIRGVVSYRQGSGRYHGMRTSDGYINGKKKSIRG